MNIDDLLLVHPVLTESSCVAWGYEFVAKWHERLLPVTATPIQGKYPKGGISFGGEFPKEFERDYSLCVEQREIAPEDLSQLVKDEDTKGTPLLCAMLYRITIPYIKKSVSPQLVWHIFVGLEIEKEIWFATRIFDSKQIVFQTIGQLLEIHRIAQSASTDRHRKVECLLHRLP